MKKILIFAVFLIPFLSSAQEKFTISGTLKGQADGETLLGATIWFKGTSIGTTTNAYGFYSLTAP
ncbi:MAG: carboxypeptidase-like regulatory domain-containing protein, partial [Bacteroidota bacterium]